MAAQGQAGGDAGQQQGEVQTGGDQNALQQGLDQLGQQLGQQFSQQLDERFAPMQDFMQQFQQPQEQEQQGFDANELAQTFGLDEQGANELAQVLQQHTSQQVQGAIDQLRNEVIGPLQEQLSDLRWNWDSGTLANEIPELQNPEFAEPVMGAADQIFQAVGQPELARNPQMVKLVANAYFGMQARQQQAEAAKNAPTPAHMEGGGGAAPQPAQQDATAEALQRLGFGDGERKFGAGAHRGVLAP